MSEFETFPRLVRGYLESWGQSGKREDDGNKGGGLSRRDELGVGQLCDQQGRVYRDVVLVLQTAVLPDAAQTGQLLHWAIYGVPADGRCAESPPEQECLERGYAYNPAVVDGGRLARLVARSDPGALQRTVTRHGVARYQTRRVEAGERAAVIGPLLTFAEFVDGIFYWLIYKRRATVVAHSVPDQLCPLATYSGEAKGSLRGGFVMRLCDCEKAHETTCASHGAYYFRQVADGVTLMGLDAAYLCQGSRGTDMTHAPCNPFEDTAMLARALASDRTMRDLCAACEEFDVPAPMVHSGPLAGEPFLSGQLGPELLSDLRVHTEAVWQLDRQLRDEHEAWRLPVPLNETYSAGAMTRGLFNAVGLEGFPAAQAALAEDKRLSPEMLGSLMEALIGPRSESMERLRAREVMSPDFRSAYTAAYTLGGGQALDAAAWLEARECTDEVRTVLHLPNLAEQLYDRRLWPQLLRTVVRIDPSACRLPVCVPHPDLPGETMLGTFNVEHVTEPGSFLLADVCDSVLHTGHVPPVLGAWTLIPHGTAGGLRPVDLFGDPAYRIDPRELDFLARLVQLRTMIKREMAQHQPGSREHRILNRRQHLLKFMASTGVYGLHGQVNVSARRSKPTRTAWYDGAGRHVGTTWYDEQPGPYFAPHLAAMCTAGARLLLGLAEKAAMGAGLDVIAMDTDQLRLARWKGMSRESFRRRVAAVQQKLEQLSPYGDGEQLLRLDERHYGLSHDEQSGAWTLTAKLAPLYSIEAEEKLHVQYNRVELTGGERGYIIRHFSEHGAIDPMRPDLDAYSSDPDIPEPWCDVAELTSHGHGSRFLYEASYRLVQQLDGGACHEDDAYLFGSPELWLPAETVLTISSASLMHQYGKLVPALRPMSRLKLYSPISEQGRRDRERAKDDGDDVPTEALTSPGSDGRHLYGPRWEHVVLPDGRRCRKLVGSEEGTEAPETEEDMPALVVPWDAKPPSIRDVLAKADLLRGYFAWRRSSKHVGSWRGVGERERRTVHLAGRAARGKESSWIEGGHGPVSMHLGYRERLSEEAAAELQQRLAALSPEELAERVPCPPWRKTRSEWRRDLGRFRRGVRRPDVRSFAWIWQHLYGPAESPLQDWEHTRQLLTCLGAVLGIPRLAERLSIHKGTLSKYLNSHQVPRRRRQAEVARSVEELACDLDLRSTAGGLDRTTAAAPHGAGYAMDVDTGR